MWSPCTRHTWEETGRHQIYRCSICGVDGYSTSSTSPWGNQTDLPIRTYRCPTCGADTPRKKAVCPRHLPRHPFHQSIESYDADFVQYLALGEKFSGLLKKVYLQLHGTEPFPIHAANGFPRQGSAIRRLHKHGMLVMMEEGRPNLWALGEQYTPYLEEDYGKPKHT